MPVGAREPERPEKPEQRRPAGPEQNESSLGRERSEPPSSRSILALQRLAGNAAVQALIGRSSPPPAPAPTVPNFRVAPEEQAAELAAGLGPEPFTVSRDVRLGSDEYRPGSENDDVFLAHELAHVHQQQADGGPVSVQAHRAAAGDRRTFVSRMLETAVPRLRSGITVQRGCTGTPALPRVDAQKVEFQASHAMSPAGGDPKYNPTWTPGAMNHAVAYTKGDGPVVNGLFRLGSPVPADTKVSVRVKEGGAVRGQVDGVAPAGTSASCSLKLTGLTDSNKIKETGYFLDWEVSQDGSSWTPVGSTGTHTVYWLNAPPLVAPLRNHAVKKAVGYAAGAGSSADAAAKIRSGLNKSLAYKPDDPINADPLTVFDDGVGICTDFGNLLTLLALSVGIQANSVMFWGGFQSMGKNVWVTKAGGLLSLTKVKSPNPLLHPAGGWDFTYHVISRIEGTLHDAALDRTGIDGEAIHAGTLVRLVELDSSPLPTAKRRRPYAATVPRKAHPVALTVRDYGQQIGSVEFGDVYPVGVPVGAPSPVEVPVVWVVSGGSLPTGLRLNFNTGAIKGKTAQTGSFPVTITVKGPASYGSAIQGAFPVTLKVDP